MRRFFPVLLLSSGCSGLFEVQGGAVAKPLAEPHFGGMMAAHFGWREDVDMIGPGATIRIDLNTEYMALEQGIHGFYLEEMSSDLALYGRIGATMGAQFDTETLLSTSAFGQFGPMFCPGVRDWCFSVAAELRYNVNFNRGVNHGPWVGLTIGYGTFW